MAERDLAQINGILRLPNREIWIITAADGAARGGCVATFVSRASIDPESPVLTAAIAVNHYTRELIDRSRTLAAHLITADEVDLVWRFGIGSGRDRDKLSGVPWRTAETGSPVLEQSLAWVDCRVFDRYDGGDRIYYWADVVASGGPTSAKAPLTEQAMLALATAEQKQQLHQSLDRDVGVQRPLYTRWRASK
jgi:flavin reductase (DIM6/NTAB) family NADH-FMN oxidoreductase RutF